MESPPAFTATGTTIELIPRQVDVHSDGDRLIVACGGWRWEFSGRTRDPNTSLRPILSE